MEGTIITIALIVTAVVAVTAIIVLGICIIHHMRLINQINMNAQLLVSEAIEKERITIEEYLTALRDVDASQAHIVPPLDSKEEDEPAFNPHNYSPVDDD